MSETKQTVPKTEEQEGKKFHAKTNNGQPQEESKEGKGNSHYKSKNKPYKERAPITLETVVPDLPKKNEMVPKPDEDNYQKELDKIEKEIDNYYKQMNDFAKESRNKNYLPQDKTFEDLISLLKVKQEEKKKAYDEFQAAVTEKDVYKKQVDDYFDRGNEYRFKMKIPGTKSSLLAQLTELKKIQSNGNISLQEEKRIIKEINDLEKSLPYAGPLEDLEKQSEEVKALLKVAKAKSNQKGSVSKLLKEECKVLQDKLTQMREDYEKKKEETTPAIDKMKEEYRNKINALKEKRKKTHENYNESWRKYEDQQAEIERIKFIKRKKEKLIRDEQRRIREEEWKKQKEAEREENKEVPYRAQIELCDLLLKYCNKLSPSVEATEAATQKDKIAAMEEALQTKEWKSTKGQILVSKKDQPSEFFFGGEGGKKKGQKKQQGTKTQEKPTNTAIVHQFETLNYFDEIKVSPPLYVEKLPETIKTIQEKKAFFEKLSQEALDAEEARKNLPEEERKKVEEEEKQKKEKEQQAKRETKKTTAKPKFDLASEQDFPAM